MKTSIDNQTGGYSDTALESALESEHCKLLEQSRLNGEHFAKQNRPYLRGDSLSPYVGEIESKYEEMKARVMQKLQPDTASREAQMLSATADEKILGLNTKRQALETEILNQELALKQSGESLDALTTLKPTKKYYLILAIIAVTEVFFNTSALQLLGDNWLVSLIIATGITSALFGLAHLLARYLKENVNNRNKRIAAIIGATILAFGVFYFLAVLRAEHLKEQAHYDIHPIFLVGINFLFYIVACWYSYQSIVPKEEREQHERLVGVKEKMDELKREDARLEAEIREIKDKTVEQLKILLYKPEYAAMLLQRISRWKTEAVETFKTVNISVRPDRQIPDCFQFQIINS